MDTRKQLQELLWEYVVDTLNYIQTVRDFCDKQQEEWTLKREEELKMMRDIKDRADQVSHKFDYLKQSDKKAKAMWECLKNSVKSEPIYKELETKLGAVLKNTLEGLEKLDVFLDAVENLAVTSPHVFTGESFWPEDESPKSVRSVITAARMTSPLLINFKRNPETFFVPSLSNLDVLTFQLYKYIQITKQICERMEKNSKSDLGSEDTHRRKKAQPIVKVSSDLSEDSILEMLDHLKELCKIRVDQHTKLALIFQDYALRFIDLFSQCHSRMEKHLSDLEECAVQLDKMKLGASISTVTGSSVRILGSALSIAGLALGPGTAGASLGLTGVSLEVTSGANSLVTGCTELGINKLHCTKIKEIFNQYMEDLDKILICLGQASRPEYVEGPAGFDITAEKLTLPAQALGKGIEDLVDGADKILKTKEVIATASTAGNQGTQSSGLSESARARAITKKALSIGLDFFFICKESISLANGSKSEASQLIRSQAALWRSELEDWKKIHDSLCIGITRESQEVLDNHFFPLKREKNRALKRLKKFFFKFMKS